MIVGNSSAGIRESSYLGIPSVDIGKRQQGRVCSYNVFHSDFDNIEKNMEDALDLQLVPEKLFGNGNASEKIIEKLKEYLNET